MNNGPGSAVGNLATTDDVATLRASMAADSEGLLGELAALGERVTALETISVALGKRADGFDAHFSDLANASAATATKGVGDTAGEFITDLLNALAPYFRSEVTFLRGKYTPPPASDQHT